MATEAKAARLETPHSEDSERGVGPQGPSTEPAPALLPERRIVDAEPKQQGFGGYWLYFTEMERLHQFPGLARELSGRELE